MKEKIIQITFSICSGFGITLLIFIGLMFLLTGPLKIEMEDALGISTLIMGTIAFGVLSAKVYGHLKHDGDKG